MYFRASGKQFSGQPGLNRRRFLQGTMLLTASLPFPVLAQHKGSGWTPCADMPMAVQEIYPCRFRSADRDLIVNAGGLAIDRPDPVVNVTLLYDLEADSWRQGVALPEARHHLALTATDSAIHALGGFRRGNADIWEMRTDHWLTEDPLAGHWESAKPLPGPRAEAVTLYLDGRIHMVGGRVPATDANQRWTDQTDTGLHWAYDPRADRWDALQPLPVPRNSSTGAVIDGQLAVISGRTVAAGNTPVCHRYDPARDIWSEMPPLPAAIRQAAPAGQAGLAGGVIEGKLCVFGGEWVTGERGVYADAWSFDPKSNRWEALEAMARPRHGHGAVAVDDAIYVLGGASGPGGKGVMKSLDRFRL
jgi:N-acetylneuraminic acid mutarotase